MILPQEFDLKKPRSAEELQQQLAVPGTQVLAGGTDLVPGLAWELEEGEQLVSLARIEELRRFGLDDDGRLVIGAMVTLEQIERSPLIAQGYPALAAAASSIATPEIRGQGTIGGNICLATRCRFRNQPPLWREGLPKGPCFASGGDFCYAAPASRICVAILSGDTVPALIALGANVEIFGRERRIVPLEEFYTGDGYLHIRLEPGEIVWALHLPAQPPRAAFRKWRLRNSIDFPEANVAVSAYRSERRWRDVKVVVSAMGAVPERIQEAEALLEGEEWTGELLQKAGALAATAIHPFDNGQVGVIGRRIAASGLVTAALAEMSEVSSAM